MDPCTGSIFRIVLSHCETPELHQNYLSYYGYGWSPVNPKAKK